MNFTFVKKILVILLRSESTYKIFSALILFVSAIFFLFVRVSSREVLTDKSRSKIHFFGDSIDGGNSTLTQSITTDSSISMKYILRKGFLTPYAGLSISDFEGQNDFSMYNKMKISVNGRKIDNIYIHINTEDANVKNKQHRLADRLSAINISLQNGRYEKPIALDMFETPSWWCHAINQPINDFGAIAWDKLVKISIVTGVPPLLDVEQELQISSMIFYNDYFYFKIWVFIGFSFLFLTLYFYHFIKVKQSSGSTITIEYKPTHSNAPENNNESEELLAYIHNNYHDPEISLAKVSDNIGVQERVISKYIKDKFACNFRTYINNIRISEAERLLKSTDLSISEVAFKVGFNDPSFFSKTFKKITGKSPSSLS